MTLGLQAWAQPFTILRRGRQARRPGEPINGTYLKADIDWLNRNPFRNVTTVAEPGGRAGTTGLKLRLDERLPLRLSSSFDGN